MTSFEVIYWVLYFSFMIMALLVVTWFGIFFGIFDHPWLRKACDLIYGENQSAGEDSENE